MSNIFLSHTNIDKPFVRKLAADLRNYGHTVWIDEAEINIGDSLIGKIREALDTVDFVAVVLSKASIQSEWVKKELEIASNREIEEKKVIILPLIIENVKLPGFLKGKLYGDFSNESEYSDKLQLLLRSLGGSTKATNRNNLELERIQQELEAAKEVIRQHKEQLNKFIEYNLSTKSESLKETILSENKNHPEYAPINNVYGFEVAGISVTIGYLLHVLRKSRMKGGHQFEWILTHHKKWNEADRMIEAYSDMINAEEVK
ncbi:MAG TPA: toll/interleukin-1 receptor domain-containing protein [Hanamia sp.]